MRHQTLLLALICLSLPATPVRAKSPPDYWQDTKDYFTSPLHWEAKEWAIAGGIVLGVGASHSLDKTARDQFAPEGPQATHSGGTRDALPLALMLAGTLAAGIAGKDEELMHTTADMGEAIVLTAATTIAFKTAFGRQRPRETSSPDHWGDGGSSFPSGHTAWTFAAAQVLADELPREKWGWRLLAYGLATATAYARMDSNAHWLSDTVAGAALGITTGRFVSNRCWDCNAGLSVGMAPLDRGAMLTFSIDIH